MDAKQAHRYQRHRASVSSHDGVGSDGPALHPSFVGRVGRELGSFNEMACSMAAVGRTNGPLVLVRTRSGGDLPARIATATRNVAQSAQHSRLSVAGARLRA